MNYIFTVSSVIEARYPYYPTLYRDTKTKHHSPYKPVYSYKYGTPSVQYFWSTPNLEYTSANYVADVTTPVPIPYPAGTDCVESKSCDEDGNEVQEDLVTTEMNETTVDMEESSRIPICIKGESVVNGSCTNQSPNDVSDDYEKEIETEEISHAENVTDAPFSKKNVVGDTTLKSDSNIDEIV